MNATMAHTAVDLATLGQHDIVLLPPLIMRDTLSASIGLATLLQQQQSQAQMPSQAYIHYAMGPSQVSFSFIVEPSISLLC